MSIINSNYTNIDLFLEGIKNPIDLLGEAHK